MCSLFEAYNIYFLRRVQRIKTNIRITYASSVGKSALFTAPLLVVYLLIIVLVDLGVIHSNPGYTIASVIFGINNTMHMLIM